MKIVVDRPALLFTLGLTGLTGLAGLLSGLLPAVQAARADLHEVLKDEGGERPACGSASSPRASSSASWPSAACSWWAPAC
jgi:hypothetical protein